MRQPPPHLRIVPAELSHVPLILSFIGKLADYERLTHELSVDEAGLREFLFGTRPAAEVILAFLGERPVGYAIFFTTFSSFVCRPGHFLEDLFVDADVRGLGIGKALLAYLAKLTKERGYSRLEWAVLDWNQPSIEFYRKLGAEALDEWTAYRLTGSALDMLARDAPV